MTQFVKIVPLKKMSVIESAHIISDGIKRVFTEKRCEREIFPEYTIWGYYLRILFEKLILDTINKSLV